jgi:putative effector of murein hydrolase
MTTNEKQPQTGMRLGYQIFALGLALICAQWFQEEHWLAGILGTSVICFLVWRYEQVCLLDGYFKQIWSQRAQH